MKPNLSDRYWLVEKFFGDQGSAFGVHAGAQRRKKCVPLFPLRRGETWYVFSGPIVLVLVLGWGIEADLPGWKRNERRKEAAEGSLGSPEKRTKDENEDEHDRDKALNTCGGTQGTEH